MILKKINLFTKLTLALAICGGYFYFYPYTKHIYPSSKNEISAFIVDTL